MEIQQPTLSLDDADDHIYAGFWKRLASQLLDLVIVAPVLVGILYLNGFGKYVYFYTCIPNLLFAAWYHVYLPKKYGGTPGKLLVGIKILKLNGEPIEWKEAILRDSVTLLLTVLYIGLTISGLLKANEEVFNGLGWREQIKYISSMSTLFVVYNWVSNIWFYSELVVLLTNRKKRALHDYIAGTVIVKMIPIVR